MSTTRGFLPTDYISDQNVSHLYDIDNRSLLSIGFGRVTRCRSYLSQDVRVMRAIPKSLFVWKSNDLDVIIRAYQKSKHPNLCRILATHQDHKYYYFIQEFCSGGDIIERLAKLGLGSEQLIGSWMRQVLSGLLYIHKQSNVAIFRDLKPENLIFASESPDAAVKICDLPLTYFMNTELYGNLQNISIGNSVGCLSGSSGSSVYYQSPQSVAESWSGMQIRILEEEGGGGGGGLGADVAPLDEGAAGAGIIGEMVGGVSTTSMPMGGGSNMAMVVGGDNMSQKTDVWSIGIITYCLIFGYMPFTGVRDVVICEAIRVGDLRWTELNCSGECLSFLKGCLAVNEVSRFDTKTALSHPWVSNCHLQDGHPLRSLSSLSMIHASQKLKRMALVCVSCQMDEGRLVDLREALLNAELTEESVLTIGEFREAANSVELDEIVESFEMLDLSKTILDLSKSTIDCDSFLEAVVRLRRSYEEYSLWLPFQSFDRDSDGIILKSEVIKALQDFEVSRQLDALGEGWRVSSLFASDLHQEIEQEGDGRIDFKKFRELLQQQ